MMRENVIKEKSFLFAIRIVNTYKYLVSNNEYVLSKQLLKSGTSIGANVREAQNAESSKDFVHKLSISQKECDETIYWLELLNKTDYLNTDEMESLRNDAIELLRMLRSAIMTTRKRMNT